MKLSPEQIRTYNALVRNRKAGDATLQVALNYHHNVHAVTENDMQRLFRDLIATYNLDRMKRWTIVRREGVLVIEEKEDEEAHR